LAEKYLKKRGLKIIERNFRNRLGEIDLIMKDQKTLVFVEVKTRKNNQRGLGREGVNEHKQYKISLMALSYLKAMGLGDCPGRFDVVEVDLRPGRPRITWIADAFEFCGD
jgi:putative endonuclease